MSRAGTAVFLDKDGTVLVDEPYNVDPECMRFAPKAKEALGRLGQLGVPLFIVSNQPGVALGRFERVALAAVEQRLAEMFEDSGARLSGCYWCPHHPAGVVPTLSVRCLCRKPLPGLLACAASEHSVDLRGSWMIGDILDDVEAGNRAGCRTIMVDCSHETEWNVGGNERWVRTPHFVVADLEVAARIVVAHSGPLAAERIWELLQ
jgi:histidinol-phosphate phosphatase family protein